MIKKLLAQQDDKRISRAEKSIALTIANVVSQLLTIFLSMISARILSKTEISIYSQTFLAYTTFSPFMTLGINQGIYYALAVNEKRKRALVEESLVLIESVSLIFSAFLLLGGNRILATIFKNPAIEGLLYHMIPYALIITPCAILTNVLVYENRLRFNAVFAVLQTLLISSFVIVSLLLFKKAEVMIVSRVYMSTILSLCLLYLVYKYVIPRDGSRLRWESMVRLLKISVPLGIANMVGTLSTNLDKWIISTMLTPEMYAIYIRGAHELPLIGTLTASISTVLLADINRAAKNGDNLEALRLFRLGAEKTCLLIMPIAVFLFVVAEPLIALLYTEAYIGAVPVFCVYLLYLPVRTVYFGPLLIALGKSKVIMWKTTIGLVTNAVLSVLFIKVFGMIGATVATIASVYFINIPINLYVISKETKVKWYRVLPVKRYLKCIILAVPGAMAVLLADTFFLSQSYALIRLCVEGMIFVAIVFPLYWKYFDDEVNSIVKKMSSRLNIKRFF